METTRSRPGIEKAINEIDEKDFRVRILGTVVDCDEENNSFMVDDGTGRARIFFTGPGEFPISGTGSLLRVLGKVRKDKEIEIDAEIIQDMSKLDLGLMNKTKDAIEKLTDSR